MTPSVDARFWSKVDRSAGPDSCWMWLASTDGRYGSFWDGKRMVKAHRFAYTTLVGPIPDGRELDHVKTRGCVSKRCVNPAHLEPVTRAVNNARGESPSSRQSRQTHCIHGHPFDRANTLISRGRRNCRTCIAARKRDQTRRKNLAA